MENYVAIVVDEQQKAFDALHKLWASNNIGDIQVRGAAVVHRDTLGRIELVTKETDPGARTVVGMTAGLLIGAIAAAAAATVVPIAVGAAVGAAAGLTADAVKSGEHQQSVYETQFILPRNKYAVIADVHEASSTAVDSIGAQTDAKVYRRTESTLLTDQWFGDDSNLYLYPYDYDPDVPPPTT
jgi:uncharacterized membrane protein